MSGDEIVNLKVGDRVVEKQNGSTPKVIVAWEHDAVKGTLAVTKPAFGEHPVRRIPLGSFLRYDRWPRPAFQAMVNA